MSEFYKHAELALIAYADLQSGAPSVEAIAGSGIVNSRARQIEQEWLVRGQVNSISGLSATVFEEISSGKRFLAIRGTDGPLDALTDLVNIAGVGVPILHPQYLVLRLQIKEWMDSNVLPSRFTVTGHSLGGFLAIGVATEFQEQVEHVYLYNAPGVESQLGGVFYPLARLFGALTPIDPSKVTNLKADAGVSVIAGLGRQVSPTTWVTIENQLLSDVPNSPAAKNHSQQVLTDSLAVYAAYESFDRSIKTSAIGQILKAASNRNVLTLESGVYLLERIVGQMFAPGMESRDELYAALFRLRDVVAQNSYGDAFKFHLFDTVGETYLKARQASTEGLAYRYALSQLNPFALVGPESIYGIHNSAGQLDLYDPEAGTGALTSEWLRDRSEFLRWKNEKYERDIADEVSLVRQDSGASSFLFSDKTLENLSGGDLVVRVAGGSVPQQLDPIRISFGGVDADTLTGGRYGDHLYGMGGDDRLAGGEGDDYLEGGTGADTYIYTSDNGLGGTDVIFDSDGQGTIIFDGVALSGGVKIAGNRYRSADGSVSYSFNAGPDGQGSLVINDVIEIRHFRSGNLGIVFETGESSLNGDYSFHYLGSRYPIEDEGQNHELLDGSDSNDEYRAGIYDADTEELQEGAIPGYFVGKRGDDRFLGGYATGGDDAHGGPGDDFLDGGAFEAGADIEEQPFGDHLQGDAGRDLILGGQFDDQLFGDFLTPQALRIAEGNAVALLGSERIEGNAAEGTFQLRTSHRSEGLRAWAMATTLDQAFRLALGIGDESEMEGLYDDLIDGREGGDTIVGGPGSDTLVGGDGDDHITGDFDLQYYRRVIGLDDDNTGFGAYTHLLGLPGDDILEGGEGDDTLSDEFGGNDALYGGEGNDILRNAGRRLSGLFYRNGTSPAFVPEQNLLDGGPGDDEIVAYTPFGYSLILGGEGDDVITFEGERAFTAEDHDEIDGYSGVRVDIDAGDGDDTIWVVAGEAEVIGGAGSDYITSRSDFLRVNQAGAVDGDEDALALEEWSQADLLLDRANDDLMLINQYSGAGVVIAGWFQSDASRLALVELDDAVLTREQIEALLDLQQAASPNDDRLYAFSGSRALFGGVGDDLLRATAGPVLLEGGEGDDELSFSGGGAGFLAGGRGNDVLVAAEAETVVAFNRGDGADQVQINGGTISVAGGIRFADIGISLAGDDLVLDLGNGDLLTLVDANAPPSGGGDLLPLRLQIVQARYADIHDLRDPQAAVVRISGTLYGGAVAQAYALDGSSGGMGEEAWLSVMEDEGFGTQAQEVPVAVPLAPLIFGVVQDSEVQAETVLSITIEAGTFLDIDSDEPLAISVSSGDGAPLPGWLSFDAQTLTLSGTPYNDDAGELVLRVTAEDVDGLSASATFSITVLHVNHPPVLGIAAATIQEDLAPVDGYLVESGVLSIVDPDAGESTYRSGIYAGTYGELTLESSGNWTYTAVNGQPAIQALGQDESLTDVITVASFDGATTAVAITIAGSNDLPVLSMGVAEVREDVDVDDSGYLTTSGTLLVSDPDAGESSYQRGLHAGSYGVLTLTGLGDWNYAAHNDQAAIQGLKTGEWLTDSIVVRAFDCTATEVTITIRGADEVAVFQPGDLIQPLPSSEPATEPSGAGNAPEEQAPAAPEPPGAGTGDADSLETGVLPVATDANADQAIGDGQDVSIAAVSQSDPRESLLNTLPSTGAPTAAAAEAGPAVSEESRRTAPASAVSPDTGTVAESDGPTETALVAADRQEPTDLPRPAATPSQEIYGLSSWEITNALLQFHLEKHSASASEDALAFGYATTRALSGVGPGSEPLMLGWQGLGTGPGQLQTFSGLQDGMRSLGAVGIG